MEDEDLVVVGRLVRPHGVRGELKLEILSDNPDRFEKGTELLLGLPYRDGMPGFRVPLQVVKVRSCRHAKGGALIAFKGCETRDDAELWRDAELLVERSEVPPAPDGLYYHFELVGCRCRDHEAGDLGEVVEVTEDGGGHLLRVRNVEREIMVPFVDDFIENVDIDAGTIDLKLPPGLIELCASGY